MTVVVLSVAVLQLSAQDAVTGKVTTSGGESLPGVNVLLKSRRVHDTLLVQIVSGNHEA